ncbi:Immediate early response 3-interacting protein 1 [Blattella germanica]|nr:Immediate early response 3-interacting protein 1 [Blattella germanica]
MLLQFFLEKYIYINTDSRGSEALATSLLHFCRMSPFMFGLGSKSEHTRFWRATNNQVTNFKSCKINTHGYKNSTDISEYFNNSYQTHTWMITNKLIYHRK